MYACIYIFMPVVYRHVVSNIEEFKAQRSLRCSVTWKQRAVPYG